MSGRRLHASALSFYLAVAVTFLMPMPLHPRRDVIQASDDVPWHIWWLWWAKTAASRGRSPYFSDLLLHPTGASLHLSATDALSALVSIPLQGLFGLVASYNLIVIAATVFGAYAMFRLALATTRSPAGALCAGALFGFAPLMSSATNLGHLEFTNIGFLPLGVLGIAQLEQGRARSVVPRALALAAALLVSWYQGMVLLFFAAFFAACRSVAGLLRGEPARLRSFLLRLSAWAGIGLLVVAPLLVKTIGEGASNRRAPSPREWIALNAAGVVEPFLPNSLNPLFGAAGDGAVRACAFGYSGLALALAGVLEARRRSAFWVLTLAVFYLLSLGPLLQFGAQRFTSALLPYNLLYALPLGDIPRQPVRFLYVAILAEAILAAWGLVWLERAAKRVGRLGPPAARSLALVLLLAEWWPAPRPVVPARIHPIYSSLKRGPPGAVLELPRRLIARAMYWQSAHGRALIGGYLSRHPPEELRNEEVPIIRQLWVGSPASIRELSAPDIVLQPPLLGRAAEILDAYGVRYVILHLDQGGAAEVARLQRALERALPASTLIFDDHALRAYQIPSSPEHKGTAVSLGQGWEPLEQLPEDGKRYRWAQGEATLGVLLLDAEPRAYDLEGVARSQAASARVEVELNGARTATLSLGPTPGAFAARLALAPGYNALRFRVREPVSPAPGRRGPSFAFRRLRVVPAAPS